ncbi:hypothetical protein BIW11_10311 [Tropilaelaps mercedesae]|uniref:Uncharacterized protein n=1 Tax=Tropilaelaps mercedesae TaxID=418985 RepID=A0A1V9XGP1_9ACAR|nr:hypothetical protein BIW11_10311 [Tropilaelaps mercedesae]
MSHGFDPGGSSSVVGPLTEPPVHNANSAKLSHQLYRTPTPSVSGQYPSLPNGQQQQQQFQLQSYSSIAGSVVAAAGAGGTSGAGGSYRPSSRLLLTHSQSAPASSYGMSLSASSLGGPLPVGHPGYKSHSLLPNGHHPSQMGAIGTVATMSMGGVGSGISGGGINGTGTGVTHHHPSLPPHSVSRLSHSFMTTFPATHHQNHTRQSSLLLNTDQNTTTQKDLSTTAPTSATGLTGAHSGSPGGGGHGGAGGGSAGGIAINSSLLTSTYHHALSLLCMLSVLMCVLSASVLRPLETTDVATERALRDVLSVCLLVLSMCLDLHCVFVCSLQLMLALREGNSAYLKRASCSRNLAVCSFLLSVPFFLTGVILLLDIPLPASLAIIGIVFFICIASSLHNVYVWHLVVQSGEASSNAKALNGHIVQLSTLV